MNLRLILGPMKSGKSLALISYFKKFKDRKLPFILFQPIRNVRDKDIVSRDGLTMRAEKIRSLAEIPIRTNIAVGIDEIHMFEEHDIAALENLINNNISVVAAGLDRDYKGERFVIIEKLMKLNPAIEYKKAFCEVCGKDNAVYTQIFKQGKPVLSGLPSVVPDDGTYTYKPVCEKCFIR